MVTKEEIARINELANKAKSEGLTDDEKQEQKQLREKYLDNIRQSLSNQVKSIKVVDPEGNDVTPDKVKQLKKRDH